jgi:energy-coupling factor transport system substrate-specific component
MIVIKNAAVRRVLKAVVPFVLIPACIAAGAVAAGEKSYPLVTAAVAALSLLLFFAGFERKKTGTRRLVIVAVMTALSVAGRFLPVFKPVTAFTVLTAVYLGGEAGFLVGSLSAAISNFYFGQGPWTPFQMFAWGIIGLAAGALARPLEKSRVLLLVFGAAAGAAYSMIMDVWTVIWYANGFGWKAYGAAVLAALPYTAVYALSNVLFLLLCARPFGEKLKRVKVKYGV